MNTPVPPNVGSSLIRIHKVFTRALAVSIQNSQGTGPEPAVRDGFQRFEQAFHSVLLAHHDAEDEIAFPFMKTRVPDGPFETLSHQHRQMMPLLNVIEDWCHQGSAAWDAANLGELHAALTELNNLWHSHIPIEESNFSPLACERLLTPEENARLDGQMSNHAAQHALPNELAVPFVIYSLEGNDRADMEKTMPPVIMEQLVPFAWKPAWAPMQPFLLD